MKLFRMFYCGGLLKQFFLWLKRTHLPPDSFIGQRRWSKMSNINFLDYEQEEIGRADVKKDLFFKWHLLTKDECWYSGNRYNSPLGVSSWKMILSARTLTQGMLKTLNWQVERAFRHNLKYFLLSPSCISYIGLHWFVRYRLWVLMALWLDFFYILKRERPTL